MHSAFKVLNLQ